MRHLELFTTLLALFCIACTTMQPVADPNFSATLDQYIATHPARQPALLAALENPTLWVNLSYKELTLVTGRHNRWDGYTPQRFWGDRFYIDARYAEQCRSLDGVMFFHSHVVVIQSCKVVATFITSTRTLRIQQFLLTEPDLTITAARAMLERRITEGMTANEIKQLYPGLRIPETARCDGKPIGVCTVACNFCEVTLLIDGFHYNLDNIGIIGVPRLRYSNPSAPLAPSY